MIEDFNSISLPFAGTAFVNKETFGQFPLQVDGAKDIHDSLESATAQGEIESVNSEVTSQSGQEVRNMASC